MQLLVAYLGTLSRSAGLQVLRAALDLGEEELGVGFSAATTARDAGDGGQPVGRLLYAVARAREDNSGLAIRLSETTRAARAAEGRAREAEAALEEARSENARLKGERGALETAVASLEAELDSTVARAVAAEGRVQDMGERMQQLEDDFMERDSEARRLRGEVERVRGDVEREVEVAGVEAQRRAQAEMGQRMEEQSSRCERRRVRRTPLWRQPSKAAGVRAAYARVWTVRGEVAQLWLLESRSHGEPQGILSQVRAGAPQQGRHDPRVEEPPGRDHGEPGKSAQRV